MLPRFPQLRPNRPAAAGRWLVLSLLLVCGSGCQVLFPNTDLPMRNPNLEADVPPEAMIARELNKVALPPHRLAPPDVVLIDAIKVVPKPPYKLEVLDFVSLQVTGTLPDQPINDVYQVQADGAIQIGGDYGSVKIMGQTLDEATETVRQHLAEILIEPGVTLRLAQSSGAQQIAGQHLIAPDGTVHLGQYGQVYVAGLTLTEAKAAIEQHLEEFLLDPQVIVDMLAYNSRVYYIISDGQGTGTGITRIPLQGHETVLDAIANINGIGGISTKNIWIARPAPDKVGYEQRLPIDFDDITARGLTATNYQILPGDRIYIEGDRITGIDARIARLTAPIERISSFILLGSGAIRNLNQSYRHDRNNNNFF